MIKSRIRKASFTGAPGENIIDAPTISLVTPGSNLVYTGFARVTDAIAFKAENNMGSAWRIRDRRDPGNPRLLSHEAPKDPRDAMLVIGSMIRDHAWPLLSALQERAPRSIQPRRRMVMFARIVLEHTRILTDRDIGQWHGVRGIVRHDGVETPASWLHHRDGRVLELSSECGDATNGIRWDDTPRRGKTIYTMRYNIDGDIEDPVIRCLRGEVPIPDHAETQEEVAQGYDRLLDHCIAFLNTSRVPRREFETSPEPV